MGGNRKVPTKIISAITNIKYLRKEYDAYLAFVVDKKIEEINLRRVPIVNKFKNVFSEELLGLPPDRNIEFEIELLPGTTLIS